MARGIDYARHAELIEICRPASETPDHVLIIARHDGGIILVRNRLRRRWELPGGHLEPGDNPRDRAAIEFFEETGQRLTDLRHCATARIRDGLTRSLRLGAVYIGDVRSLRPFRQNAETVAMTLWRNEQSAEIDRAAVGIIRECRRTVSELKGGPRARNGRH
jgi:8-oxo-dGTP diphosphatase